MPIEFFHASNRREAFKRLLGRRLAHALAVICMITLVPVQLRSGKPNPPNSAISMTCLADGTIAQDVITCSSPQRVEFTGSGYNRVINVYVDGTSVAMFIARRGNFDFILNFSSLSDRGIHTIDIYDVAPGGKSETFGNSATLTIS